MADISSKCLKLISRIPEADQDFLVERIDQLQAEGVSSAEAQQRAAQDLLERVEGDAMVTRSVGREEAVRRLDEAAKTAGVTIKLGSLEPDQHAADHWNHDGPEVWLEWIESRKKGAGAEAMRKLVAEADATNTLIRGSLDDNGSGKLEAYYRQFGFTRDSAGGDIIERPPVTRSASRAPAGVEIVEVEDGFDAMKDGKRIGRLRDNLPRGAAEQLDENASVDIVKVEPEFKGQGVGAALYDAFNEKHGGRITPSGKTSPEAWALWKRQFPEKVDAFVEAEAGRIRDGASVSMVVRNITDPDVARRVAEAAGDVAMRSADRTDTPEFKAWFGDSRVTETGRPGGKPLVVYHGRSGEFEGNSFGTGQSIDGAIFFTTEPTEASWYATGGSGEVQGNGEHVMPVFLSIQNPYSIDLKGKLDYEDYRIPDAIEYAKARGHDGLIVDNAWNGNEETGGPGFANEMQYVAFDPKQIKSAIGNNGSFDPAEDDILRSAQRPEFFSQLQRSIEAVPDRLATMAAPQWKLWLDANAPKLGVKKDEIEWSGVKDYLDLRGKDKVTRDEIVAYLADSGVRVEETVLGSTGLRDTGEMYVAEANDWGDEWAVFTEDGSIIGGTYESEGAAEQAMDQMNTEGKPTKYGGYTVPGGENYREVLITLPPAARKGRFDVVSRKEKSILKKAESREEAQAWIDANSGMPAAKGAEIVERESGQAAAPEYKSGHWDQPNILAHLRVDDRTDADGNKVLFINEIQSDWGQQGKKEGFFGDPIPQNTNWQAVDTLDSADTRAAAEAKLRDLEPHLAKWAQEGVEDRLVVRENDGQFEIIQESRSTTTTAPRKDGVLAAPFVRDTKAWASLALKRAIMMAVEGGYDRVALITGDQAADLYSLSKQIDNAKWSRRYDGGRMVTLVDLADKEIGVNVNAEGVVVDSSVNGAEGKGLDEVVGKGLAEKIMAEESGNLSGLDLNVGGDGMRSFYDQIIPQVARDVLKKLGGGQLQQVVFGGTNEENGRYAVVDSSTGETVFRTDSEKEAREYRLAYPEASRIAEMSDDAPSRQVAMGENPGFDITPAMREKVASGVPLFSKGRTSTGADWESPSASKFDEMIYKFQDKQVDTKRVVEAIKAASGAIADDLNVYLNEELYHGRTAKRTEDFLNMELNPLIEDMAKAGLTIADVEEFLHARHAKEANAVIAARNPGEPGLQDGGSGMTNSEADQYMASLPAADRAKLEAAAARVDGIIAGTRKIFVDNDLESQATVDGWNGMFKHYIPLQREDKEGKPGLGQGFSVKGRETKGRTGSTRKVVDILANVAMQRERAIVRGEKNRVAQALVGLARANENPEFWLVDEVPSERVFNPDTGLVEDRHDPMYKSRENAVVAKIKDPSGAVREHVVLFNEEDERALRMAQALKNLDAQQLNGLLGVSAKITRYFAAVNTQYNPVFGVVNLVRDVQGAMLNLTSTPLKDDKAKIAKYTASALAGIYGDMRAARKGKNPNSQWAKLWDEFQEVGGQTGYRDLFATSSDRAEAIQRALDPTKWMDSPLGKVFTAGGALKVPLAQAQKQAGFLFDWLSDYNGAMENGVRLAAYKAGLERGMSKEQAASVAKNLTTNFNRKGQAAQQAGAMYAFFNAAIQGTARIGQTLFTMEPGKPKTLRLSPTGKKIVLGGMVLGSVQALALAGAGFSDEDPPEFARERSLIIPTGGKTYVSIPMPLGMHVIPNIGRMATEFALSGFKDPVKRSIKLTALFADAFNPIGNAGLSMQTLAPTALDPLVALTENKDYTGKPIAKTSSNKAIPGHALGRDTSTMAGELISEAINTLSGGNEHVAGVFSPTPDQLDFLIGQVTGGVGREYSKTEQTLKSAVRGEELPTYKIPLVGRFVGNAKGQASEGSAFYANVDKLNEIETEAKGLRADGKRDEAAKLLASKPESYLIAANTAERQAQKLRREKSELVKAGASREQVKAKEEAITATMARFNRSMEALREREAATN